MLDMPSERRSWCIFCLRGNGRRRSIFYGRSYIEPHEDDRYKIRFIEDGGSYVFMMYKEPRGGEDTNFGFYRGGLDVKGHYSGFKNGLRHEVLFTYGFSDGEHLRMSDRYKTVRDVKILNRTDVTRNSEVWRAIESRSVGR